jgi:hypothetical protein
MTKYDILVLEIKKEFPSFKIVPKSESWLSKTINVLLLIITFGQQKTFMSRYTTTIGNTIYTPANWDKRPETSRLAILRHERVHLRQAKKYTRFFFSFLYLFVFFPTVFAYFRKKFEQEAYEESIRARIEYSGIEYVKRSEYKAFLVKQLTSAQYFWTWPFKKSIEKWFDETLEKILKELDNG